MSRSSASLSTKKARNEPSIPKQFRLSDFLIRSPKHFFARIKTSLPKKLQKKADDAALDVVVYISMAFGNPYGDLWNPEEVIEAISLMEVDNLRMISLADTVGMASPQQISELVGAVMAKYDYLEIGVHLHSRPEQAPEKILAAYDAGCRRFDSALAGLGGCPFAQDALVGNIPTEKMIETLRQRGADLPALKPLDSLLKATSGMAAKYSQSQAAD